MAHKVTICLRCEGPEELRAYPNHDAFLRHFYEDHGLGPAPAQGSDCQLKAKTQGANSEESGAL